MKKFKKTFRGYKVDEVNSFVCEVVSHVEGMINEIKDKNKEILLLKEQIKKYKRMEDSSNKSILMVYLLYIQTCLFLSPANRQATSIRQPVHTGC